MRVTGRQTARFIWVTTVVAYLAVAGLAPAAIAGEGVGAFVNGNVDVGKTRLTECTKQGGGDVTGHGIGLPADPLGLNDPKESPTAAYYKFDKVDGVLFADTNANITTNGSFHLCGAMAAVAGMGAACGMSSGYDGMGKFYSGPNFIDPLFMIQDLEWLASAGRALPITGRVDAWNATKTKGTKSGTLVALFELQGGTSCINPQKATDFILHGIIGLIAGAPFLDDLPVPGTEPGTEPCSDSSTRVERVQRHTAGQFFEVDVHQAGDEVIVCVTAESNGNPVFERTVRVSTNPTVPVEVDEDAPPGDAPTSPCTEIIDEGGTQSITTYVRSTPPGESPTVICAGARANGSEHHVRVTIG